MFSTRILVSFETHTEAIANNDGGSMAHEPFIPEIKIDRFLTVNYYTRRNWKRVPIIVSDADLLH